MKKIAALLLCVILALSVSAAALADTSYLVFSTGGTTGVYYVFGGELATLWMNHVEGVDVTVESSGGSKDNILALFQNDAEIAWTQNDVMSYAYDGGEFFAGQVADNYSAIGAIYPEVIQLVVAKDSGIKSVKDLAGHNVSVGPMGSGHYFNAMQILEINGMTVNDIKPQYLSNSEVIDSFQNRQIDAFFLTAAYPHATVTDVCLKRDIDIIGFTADEIAALQASYSFFVTDTIPAGTYNGVDEEKLVPAISAVLVARDDVDEEVVYQLTKALFENVDDLTNAKKAYISAENAVKGIPVRAADAEKGVTVGSFHPGALRYYKELGLIAE
ncbi:MAG: TAXI family TRAP transporter solute-binding subunit [Clostridia bacterium]|nr:TAXI family TRAP transporter solute-binding subunit [Clostridia bacterium]